MTAPVTQAIKFNNVSIIDSELQKTDRKATDEVVHPKRGLALSLSAGVLIGRILVDAAKDISGSMQSLIGDATDLPMVLAGETDVAEPADDHRADADATEPGLDADAESVEDEDWSDAEDRSDEDTESESGSRGQDGDGQPRDGQSSKQQPRDDSGSGSLAIDSHFPRRRESGEGDPMSPPGARKMLIEGLEAAYKKAEVTLRQIGGMAAMNLPVKMDQLTHAPELILMQLNMELSQIIDHALYSQLADQKSRNAMIADHQTMMDALRVEKGSIGDTESFDWASHNSDIALHPESPARAEAAKAYTAFLGDPYIKNLTEGFHDVKLTGIEVGVLTGTFLVLRMTRSVNNVDQVKECRVDLGLLNQDQPHLAKLAADYVAANRRDAGTNPGSIKLMDCLKLYGIVAEGKEPKNGGEVDAYIQKIKGVVDKLSSSQQLDMVRLQKMTNSRNEAFSMISNVNKQALDNRMAIVNNLR